MSQYPFQLQPFSPPSNGIPLSFGGQVTRQSQVLQIQYQLQGDMQSLIIPPPNLTGDRGDDLWTATCFELFLGRPDELGYWEFNCSPASSWNCYRFDNYRQGMIEEEAVQSLPTEWIHQPDQLYLQLDLDLSSLGLATASLDLSITAVIEHLGGEMSYWAIAHGSEQADFHLRKNFSLHIPPP